MVPALFVDLLPEWLWSSANLYRVFGRDLHLCVGGDGHRTVELDGREIGRGNRSLAAFSHGPGADVRPGSWGADFGWVAVGVVVGLLLLVVLVARRST